MPVTVRIPTVLRAATDGQKTVAVDGATVGDVLGRLADGPPRGARAGLHRRRARCTGSSTST